MTGTVYFLQVQPDGPIKIGYTSAHVSLRVACLQASSPYELKWIGYFDGTMIDEKAAHAGLATHRLRNEWFHPTPEVLAFVNEKCPAFDEAAYLREVFHDEHRLVVRSVPTAIRGQIADKLRISYASLVGWLSAKTIIDRSTAIKAASLARELSR